MTVLVRRFWLRCIQSKESFHIFHLPLYSTLQSEVEMDGCRLKWQRGAHELTGTAFVPWARAQHKLPWAYAQYHHPVGFGISQVSLPQKQLFPSPNSDCGLSHEVASSNTVLLISGDPATGPGGK